MGAFAVRMAKVAIPVIKKYILLAAKVGKSLFEAALPEMGQVLSGNKRVSRKTLKSVVQNSAEQTLAENSKMLKATKQSEGSQKTTDFQRAGRNGGVRAGSGRTANRKRFRATSSDKTTTSLISGKSPATEVGPIFCPKFNSQQFESRTASWLLHQYHRVDFCFGSAMEIASPVTYSALDFFEKHNVLIKYEGSYDQEVFPHVGYRGRQLDIFISAESKTLFSQVELLFEWQPNFTQQQLLHSAFIETQLTTDSEAKNKMSRIQLSRKI